MATTKSTRRPRSAWFFHPRRVPSRYLFKVNGTSVAQVSKNKTILLYLDLDELLLGIAYRSLRQGLSQQTITPRPVKRVALHSIGLEFRRMKTISTTDSILCAVYVRFCSQLLGYLQKLLKYYSDILIIIRYYPRDYYRNMQQFLQL